MHLYSKYEFVLKIIQINIIYVIFRYMFPENIEQTLDKLGLKNNEITIYLTCLEHKEGLFVAEITHLTNIKRSSTILILDRLVKKGFISFHTAGRRKRFCAEPPESILFSFEESVKDFRSVVQMLKLITGSDQKTKVRFFEGKEGIEKIYADRFLTVKMSKDPAREILAISSGNDVFTLIPERARNFIQKRVKEQIPIRWIAPESKVAREYQRSSAKEYRQMKFFDPKKYPFRVEMDIYGGKVALMSFENGPSGVIIENQELTDSLRSIFNLLWSLL